MVISVLSFILNLLLSFGFDAVKCLPTYPQRCSIQPVVPLEQLNHIPLIARKNTAPKRENNGRFRRKPKKIENSGGNKKRHSDNAF
jgi:hypothetical protein